MGLPLGALRAPFIASLFHLSMATFRFPRPMLQNLRYAFRSLLKTRGFTVVAVLTLAVGIGANTAIFSVAHALLLTPPDFPEPERIMVLNETRLPLT